MLLSLLLPMSQQYHSLKTSCHINLSHLVANTISTVNHDVWRHGIFSMLHSTASAFWKKIFQSLSCPGRPKHIDAIEGMMGNICRLKYHRVQLSLARFQQAYLNKHISVFRMSLDTVQVSKVVFDISIWFYSCLGQKEFVELLSAILEIPPFQYNFMSLCLCCVAFLGLLTRGRTLSSQEIHLRHKWVKLFWAQILCIYCKTSFIYSFGCVGS